MIFLQNRSSILLDDDFCEKLDSYSGCKLPVVLKEKICNLIQTFCFNPRVPVNLDVNSINGLPDEMKKSFCNLLNYVSNINSRTPKLILDLVKLFADSADTGPCTQSVSFRARDNSTGGKMPRYGPRRLLNPGPLFQGDFCTTSNKISVSKSQIDNCKAICKLSSSQFKGEDAVYLYGVRCTFWALGESLKPGGAVKSYVISVFCYSLFQKPNGHPDISKRHYFFPNIAENLLKDPEFADEDVLSRAFRRSSKARALHLSNMLYFPICHEDHWFVFVVDIKDKKYVILDSFFTRTDEYQQILSEKMRSAFEFYWQKYIHFDMGFDEYDFIFPVVPQQPLDNTLVSYFNLNYSLLNLVHSVIYFAVVFCSKDIQFPCLS
ncbi:hypothetical protein HU200_043489 [Digitaria exilis]|uniref:Ubiquitin-like protease family profile domain-containing protein n=1 Tax=Digitaria exilis TaxID=1010633 RepID=A0A835BB49_9POAL|nr:hypothetical protein HU200_043489 [Digitaria exilis]